MRKFLLGTFALTFLFTFSGCGKPPAQKILDKSIQKMSDIESFAYDLKIGAHGAFPDLNAPSMVEMTYKNGRVIFDIKGKSDIEKMRHFLDAKLDYKINDNSLELKIELLHTPDTLYFLLKQAPELAGIDMAPILEKWYKFDYKKIEDVGENNVETIHELSLHPPEESIDSKKVKKIRKLAKKLKFLQVEQDLGVEKLPNRGKIQTHHFIVKINEKELADFFTQAAEISSNEKLPVSEKAKLANNLAEYGKIQADLWINEKENLIYRVEIGHSIENEKSNLTRVDLALDLKEFDKKQTIILPEKVFEFDDLASLFLGITD